MSDRPSTCIYRDASTQEIYMHVYTDAWHVEPYTRTSKQLTTYEQLVLIMSSKFILMHIRQADTTSSTWSSSTLPQATRCFVYKDGHLASSARRFTDDGIDDHMIYDSKTASTKSSCDICKAQSPSDMCKTYSSSDICKTQLAQSPSDICKTYSFSDICKTQSPKWHPPGWCQWHLKGVNFYDCSSVNESFFPP